MYVVIVCVCVCVRTCPQNLVATCVRILPLTSHDLIAHTSHMIITCSSYTGVRAKEPGWLDRGGKDGKEAVEHVVSF